MIEIDLKVPRVAFEAPLTRARGREATATIDPIALVASLHGLRCHAVTRNYYALHAPGNRQILHIQRHINTASELQENTKNKFC